MDDLRSRPILRVVVVLAAAVAVLGLYLSRYPLGGFRTPLGADANVYLWWSNLASIEGLSVAGWRPGIPALVLMLDPVVGGLGRPAIMAGIGAALAASAALAAGALTWADHPHRATWVVAVAALLTGAYAGHLVGGYLGASGMVVGMLAAAALLVEGSSVAAAAMVLGVAGLAHPLFLAVAVTVFGVAAAISRGEERRRVAVVAGAGGAVTGLGLATMLWGARPPTVDTSGDALMRRMGAWSELTSQYRQRVGSSARWYQPWIYLPLAVLGRAQARPLARRLLDAWVVVCGVGFVVAWLWGRLPPLRWLGFAFALPVLAALAMERIARMEAKLVAGLLIALLVGVSIWQAAMGWSRVQAVGTPDGVAAVEELATRLPGAPGTPFVLMTDGNTTEVVAYVNLVRAYLPPERIRDLFLMIGDEAWLRGSEPSDTGDASFDQLADRLERDLVAGGADPSSVEVVRLSNVQATDSTTPSSWGLVAAGVAVFLALLMIGLGWSLAVVRDVPTGVALAPAFGMVGCMAAGMLLDRVGVRLVGGAPAAGLVVLAVGGYALAWRLRSRRIGEER